MKTLMIMGGGIYQLPLILKAKEMGIRTVAVSIPGPYPGLAAADEVLELDTRDAEGVLRAARRIGIDGITTSGTDVAVRTIGLVNDALGLHGISAESAAILTDKARMKTAFRGHVTTSEFREIRSYEELQKAAGEIGYPLMVKACDVSGSRGITKVEEESGLREAYDNAFQAGRSDHILAEGFIEGEEFGVDAFVEGGKAVMILPHRKFLLHTDRTDVPAGHIFPLEAESFQLYSAAGREEGQPAGFQTAEPAARKEAADDFRRQSEHLSEAIAREVNAIICAAQLTNTALNADMMLRRDGSVSVIEAGGRAGATCIPELIERYTGTSWYEQIIRSALGMPTVFSKKGILSSGISVISDFAEESDLPGGGTPRGRRRAMARLIFAGRDGRVRAIDETLVSGLKSEGYEVSYDVQAGEPVHLPENGTDRIGQILADALSVPGLTEERITEAAGLASRAVIIDPDISSTE